MGALTVSSAGNGGASSRVFSDGCYSFLRSSNRSTVATPPAAAVTPVSSPPAAVPVSSPPPTAATAPPTPASSPPLRLPLLLLLPMSRHRLPARSRRRRADLRLRRLHCRALPLLLSAPPDLALKLTPLVPSLPMR
ncbi:unnamed protein product [Linum tenue]|uniref:Uncharacterized protein n=1 Tax=Linum tenue TaxID=586396 RepID=A0AAV0L848_9ROSI|nr:unnamed protein product [Linum tenue]